MKVRNGFFDGMKCGIPIFLGYLSVSFAFGIFSIKSGLTVLEAILISFTNLTSAGQIAAVPIIASGGSLIELAATQFVINLRYSLMSVSLSQKLSDKVTWADKLLIGFAVTDEVFAVSVSKEETLGKRFMLGLASLPMLGWTCGTAVGALAGSLLPDMVIGALGIAIYGMFIAIIMPAAKKNLRVLFCVLSAAALSCILNFVPIFKGLTDGFIIIICAVSMSILFALIAPIKESEGDTDG